jgi:predicted AAA+ superfamily ATPase
MTLKPWREIVLPHPDVLEGTFLQSEFAADITAVATGQAPREYQDARAFFERTYITEGMRHLLVSVVQRLSGQGGDPVIQLQTSFGGGKTHTMLAVYHMATRTCSLNDMAGIPALLDRSGLMHLPTANVAVLDGTAHAPGQAWTRGQQTIRTLWGELAWQLGGADAYGMVASADASGTSPGKDVLRVLLERFAPCVVLMDELVAYIRQFPEGQALSGGTFDSNLSFVQALTEAAKLVPTAIILASLPESEIEAGSQRGQNALYALEKTFGRVQALWKPVGVEESFEIVRRRLFEQVHDPAGRDAVCRSFAETYVAEGAKFPGITHEARYQDRLLQAYPIHPEVFDRLYEDWSTLDSFQRTRGVLKFMALVIFRLWQDNNRDFMILPGSIPLCDPKVRGELTAYLSATPGWDAVIDRDVDSERAETTLLETREPRFGTCNAARRVARTVFLGSAPAATAHKPGIRGLDRARILLGCMQPGQTVSLYADALSRLADRLQYMNASGDSTQDATRFWFDVRANLRREMEDRKNRFNDKNEITAKLAAVLKKLTKGLDVIDGVHIFTTHGDVPDDESLRLVVLPPDHFYSKSNAREVHDEVLNYLQWNGTKPRYKGNRLLFLAPDHGSWGRLQDAIRTALAWASIMDDIQAGRINIDRAQEAQAKREHESAENVLPRAVRECHKWLLCPVLFKPTDTTPEIESYPVSTAGNSLPMEIERICRDNELIITEWSPIHLRGKLQELYWKNDNVALQAQTFWEDSQKFLYLPRLRGRHVLEKAIKAGAGSTDFFGTAYGQKDCVYEGFQFGNGNVQVDGTLLLIEPVAARAYADQLKPITGIPVYPTSPGSGTTPIGVQEPPPGVPTVGTPPTTTNPPQSGTTTSTAKSFHGCAEISPSAAKARLIDLAEEIIAVLGQDPNAEIRVNLEIHADYPNGASDQIKRAVTLNAKMLGLKTAEWEG